jgi:hypothetical protein
MIGGSLALTLDGSGSVLYAAFSQAFGPETYYLTLATSNPGATAAPSFAEAMTTSGDAVFNFVKCLPGKICTFTYGQ